jgi:hypothetical protein
VFGGRDADMGRSRVQGIGDLVHVYRDGTWTVSP